MRIRRQISVFVENKPGRLSKVLEALRDRGICVEAFMIADAGEFGIIHLLLSDPDRGKERLMRDSFVVSEREVLVLGSVYQDLLLKLSTELGMNGINIQYAYGALAENGSIVMKLSDLKRGEEVLKRIAPS
ncbi:MAG: acetolactate synthase [Candidatus Bathyarchaeia archaeon]